MRPKLDMIEKTFVWLWPVMIVTGVLVFIVSLDFSTAASVLLGGVTSLFANSLQYRYIKSTPKELMHKLQSRMVMMYFLKLLIYATVMTVVALSTNMSVAMTFVGIILYYVTLFVVSLVITKKQAKEEQK